MATRIKKPNSALTVTGGATALLTGGAEITGAVFAQGVEATHGTVTIEAEGTRVFQNDYAGVVAMPGATITIRDGASVVENLGGGLVASGQGARIDLDLANVLDNRGAGVYATDGGLIQTVSSGSGVGSRTIIDENDGGLSALAGGSIDLGTCKGGVCSDAAHKITDNDQDGAFFDAHSFSASVVRAQGNDWEVADVACLVLGSDASSTLLVEPLIGTGPTCLGGALLRSEGGTPSAGKSGGPLVAAIEAEDAAADGDAATAMPLRRACSSPARSPQRRPPTSAPASTAAPAAYWRSYNRHRCWPTSTCAPTAPSEPRRCARSPWRRSRPATPRRP